LAEPASPQPELPVAPLHPKSDWRTPLAALDGAYAERTLQGYRDDFSIFEAWCAGAGLSSLPAQGSTIAGFITAQFGTVAVRTVQRRLAAIRKIHQVLGLTDASRDEGVLLAIRRGLRQHGRRPRQALGLSATLRDHLIASCPSTLKGIRDRAVIAVGYDTLSRRSELAALTVEDVSPLNGGGAKVLIGRAKNDPFGDGECAYLSQTAYAYLQAWLRHAKIDTGPLFRPVFRTVAGAGGFHPRTVNRILRDAAKTAGWEASIIARVSAHSLRVGPAQDLVIAGHSILQIMRAGRWRHVDAISDYVRSAEVNVWLPQPTGRTRPAAD
jgi:integrase/recombinase XerD